MFAQNILQNYYGISIDAQVHYTSDLFFSTRQYILHNVMVPWSLANVTKCYRKLHCDAK